jgi:hypothetical protein
MAGAMASCVIACSTAEKGMTWTLTASFVCFLHACIHAACSCMAQVAAGAGLVACCA